MELETVPSFLDFLGHGPFAGQAMENRNRRKSNREIANFNKQRLSDLLELSFLNNANQVEGFDKQPELIEQNGFTLPNPIAGANHLNPKQQAELLVLGDAAGVSTSDIAGVQDNVRRNALIPELPINQQVDALASKAITGPASTAALNAERANQVSLRTSALSNVLNNPDLDPLISADVANDKSVADTQRVKVQRKDGTEGFFDARLNADGSFSYSPSTGPAGEPLTIKPSGSDGRTSLQKDTAFIQDVFNVDAQEALKLKLELKSKSPEEAYSALVERLATGNSRLLRKPDKLKETAAKVWQVSRPGVPIPEDGDNIISNAVNGSLSTESEAPANAQSEVRERAIADGYSNLGEWTDGKGWAVFDDTGKLIGHYN